MELSNLITVNSGQSGLWPIRNSAVSGRMVILQPEFNALYSGQSELRGIRTFLAGSFSVRIGQSWLYFATSPISTKQSLTNTFLEILSHWDWIAKPLSLNLFHDNYSFLIQTTKNLLPSLTVNLLSPNWSVTIWMVRNHALQVPAWLLTSPKQRRVLMKPIKLWKTPLSLLR